MGQECRTRFYGVPIGTARLGTASKACIINRSFVLDILHGPCQEILELRYFADLSYEEIAASLALNPKTVSSRLSKCLDKLETVTRSLLAREEDREKKASTSV